MPEKSESQIDCLDTKVLLTSEALDRLQAAVLEVFSNEDFHRASIRAVAKTAKISSKTIYRLFGTKEGLLFYCVDIWLKELTERITDHLKGLDDLKEKLRKVFWVQLDYYEHNPRVGRILFLTIPSQKWLSDDSFKQKRMIKAFLEVITLAQQVGTLRSDLPPHELLDLMSGLIQRHFQMWIYRGQKEGLTDNFNTRFEMIWRGMTKPPMRDDLG
jgi:AcrR family transcriptional regulator